MSPTLSIDLETYSSVDIRKGGLFRYVQAPDFQVLLFAYSMDGAPVQIVDIAQGERPPADVMKALLDPEVIKQAYNAPFEWYCLSKVLNVQPEWWLPQWRCTMVHGLYCGYPAGLAAVSAAVGLPEDKRKMGTGAALIRTFCVPCEPTKANGNRTRTLPHHEPEKWQLFKEYCKQDVVAEMEIARRLSGFPAPEKEHRLLWELDQRINLRGVAVDHQLIDGALHCSETVTSELMAEATSISGLDNPKSVAQLTEWLTEETEEDIPNLQKSTVAALLQTTDNEKARRMLEIRQELAKTSVKKYAAMRAAVCEDGRIRGLLQFYGANRTGRWAGKLVQVQNLPRNYLETLGHARECVRGKQVDLLKVIYGNLPDTLSQLIRTAFIPSRGHKFIVADFSAIEARVLAWLAGEQWRLDVFATHGKIYEASASQMFGVPLELIKKGNPEYELRQRGKVAELGLGYGMGASKFKDTAERQYNVIFTEDEAKNIVTLWRNANRRIVDLWYALEGTAVEVVRTGSPAGTHGLLLAREADSRYNLDFLTVTLPSGRKLYYAKPFLQRDEERKKDALFYKGLDQTTKKWGNIYTYSGKLVENVIQAIARDCLAEALVQLYAAGYNTVIHVHDEVVLDVPNATDEDLQRVIRIMEAPIPWAPGLLLRAEGFLAEYYMKD